MSVFIDTGMKPGFSIHRWQMQILFRGIWQGSKQTGLIESTEGFGVPLLHHAEATKLTILAVEITVVILIYRDQFTAGYQFTCFRCKASYRRCFLNIYFLDKVYHCIFFPLL